MVPSCKTYSLTFDGIGGDNSVYGDCATATNDGNVVLGGHYWLLIGSNSPAFLMKVSPEGDVILEQEYSNVSSNIIGDHYPTDVIQTSDGGYLMVGVHKTETANPDIFMLKTDGNLQYQWDRSFGGSGADIANSVIEESDGGFVIVGCTKSNLAIGEEGRVYIIKTDNLGNIN